MKDWHYSHIATDPDEIAKLYAAEMATCIRLTAAVPMTMLHLSGPGQSGVQALAFLDVAKRPDLQRLYQKLSQANEGDVVAAWRFLTGAGAPKQTAILDCQWTAPMEAGFRVAFDLLAHRDFLETVLERGYIQFAFGGKPGRAVLHTVAVPITQFELVAILAMTEPLYQQQVRRN